LLLQYSGFHQTSNINNQQQPCLKVEEAAVPAEQLRILPVMAPLIFSRAGSSTPPTNIVWVSVPSSRLSFLLKVAVDRVEK
jgi:hypothetical protein